MNAYVNTFKTVLNKNIYFWTSLVKDCRKKHVLFFGIKKYLYVYICNLNYLMYPNVQSNHFCLFFSVVDPKLFFPDPTYQEISDPAPDPISDPT
jgi:hypothetical protein